MAPWRCGNKDTSSVELLKDLSQAADRAGEAVDAIDQEQIKAAQAIAGPCAITPLSGRGLASCSGKAGRRLWPPGSWADMQSMSPPGRL